MQHAGRSAARHGTQHTTPTCSCSAGCRGATASGAADPSSPSPPSAAAAAAGAAAGVMSCLALPRSRLMRSRERAVCGTMGEWERGQGGGGRVWVGGWVGGDKRGKRMHVRLLRVWTTGAHRNGQSAMCECWWGGGGGAQQATDASMSGVACCGHFVGTT